MSTDSSSPERSNQADGVAYPSMTAQQSVTAQSSSIGQVALPVREKSLMPSLDSTDGYIPASEERSDRCSSPKDLSPSLVLRISNEFTPIIDERGDTLIYIGPPAKIKDQPHSEYLHIEHHFNRFYLVDSNKLKALNSSEIKRLLSPRPCIFAAKRFKTLDSYQALSQQTKNAAKYHVDLRPAQIEDEAIMLLTELSCSKGICNWYLARGCYSVPHNVVMGTDHLDTESNPYYTILDTSSKQNNLPDLGPVADYSALRHHSGLERLLHAACGQDPKLDSAPKMWTFFSLALFFDCAGHPLISQWISSWLKAPGNNNFIQNNPEIAFRIGMGIMDVNLVRVAFSILVGEKALMLVCNEGKTTIAPRPVSVHGRMLDNLDDDEQNRISHAASSLVSRMMSIFKSVVDDLDWMIASTEYRKLLDTDTDSYAAGSAVYQAKTLLKEYVKGRCLTILYSRLREAPPDLEKHPQKAAPFRHGLVPCFEGLYSNLQPNARLFTRSFWIVLSKCTFSLGFNNTDVSHIKELVMPSGPDNFPCVTRKAVYEAFDILNQTLSHQDRKPEPSVLWPSDSHGQHQNQYSRDNTAIPPLLSTTTSSSSSPPPPPPPPQQQQQQQHDNPQTTTDDQQPSIFSNSNQPRSQPIDARFLLSELSDALASHICDPIVYPNHLFHADDPVHVDLIDHLLNLDESEWKFLPLWAGGLDDGSGGVFAGQDIPDGPTTTGAGGSRSSHHNPDGSREWWLFQGGKRGIRRSPTDPHYHDNINNDDCYSDGDGDGASFDWISTDGGIDSLGKASRVAVATAATTATAMTDSTLSAVVVVGGGRGPTATAASVRTMSEFGGGASYSSSPSYDGDRRMNKAKGKMKEATAAATSADTMTDTIMIDPVTGDNGNSNWNNEDIDGDDDQRTIMRTFNDHDDDDDDDNNDDDNDNDDAVDDVC